MTGNDPQRVIVGITGATGSVFGVRMLQVLQGSGIETNLIISKWGLRTLVHEMPDSVDEVKRLATAVYSESDLGAVISSGSFETSGMVIVPCSMRTLGAIAHGTGDNLIHRAADVVLKERRRLVLVAREAPLSEIHLENMLKLARMGASVIPPVPAFYDHPHTIDDIVNHIVMRVLDQLGIHFDLNARWNGLMSSNRVHQSEEP